MRVDFSGAFTKRHFWNDKHCGKEIEEAYSSRRDKILKKIKPQKIEIEKLEKDGLRFDRKKD